MSTTTLSQRLRDLKAMCITHGERHSIPNETAHWLMVGAVDELEKAIAQAEAQEAQAISPEARDRAISALEITSRALANYESGVPIKVDDLRKWNSQALSALRGLK